MSFHSSSWKFSGHCFTIYSCGVIDWIVNFASLSSFHSSYCWRMWFLILLWSIFWFYYLLLLQLSVYRCSANSGGFHSSTNNVPILCFSVCIIYLDFATPRWWCQGCCIFQTDSSCLAVIILLHQWKRFLLFILDSFCWASWQFIFSSFSVVITAYLFPFNQICFLVDYRVSQTSK